MVTDLISKIKELEGRIKYLETAKMKYFDDIQVPALLLTRGGTGIPALEVFKNGVYLYTFTDESVAGNEKQLFFTLQLPHSWKAGSVVEPHIHYSPYTNTAGTVRFGLEYVWQSINGVYGATEPIIYVDADKGSLAFAHKIKTFGNISGAGQTASSVIVGRVFRNSSHGNDNYADKVFIVSLDFHIEHDKLGDLTAPAVP